MIKENIIKSDSKNNTHLKIKKIVKNQDNIFKNKNSNKNKKSKNINSNLNSKIKIEKVEKAENESLKNSENVANQKSYNKMIINNIINEDKDLETLLSILKTSLNPNTQHNNKNEIYLNLKKNSDLLCDNEFCSENKDGIKEENNNNLIPMNFHIDLKEEEEEDEISQRVHAKNPIAHTNPENKIKSLNKDKENNNSKKISLNLIKKFHKNIKKDTTSRQNQTNIKYKTFNNYRLSCNNKKSNLTKYKTFKNKIDDNYVNQNQNQTKSHKKKNKNLDINEGGIFRKNKINKILITLTKHSNSNNSIGQNIVTSNKTSLCTPKDNNNSNKTIIYENAQLNYINRIKNINIKSYKKIGDLYIKNKSLKDKKDKNKLFTFKRNKTNINPFNNISYEMGKFPIIKKVNYYKGSICQKSKIKKNINSSNNNINININNSKINYSNNISNNINVNNSNNNIIIHKKNSKIILCNDINSTKDVNISK